MVVSDWEKSFLSVKIFNFFYNKYIETKLGSVQSDIIVSVWTKSNHTCQS